MDYHAAKQALTRLVREPMDINPSAARSLEEGWEETLTVHRLGVPEQLRRTLSNTNVIESAFSVVETVCRNVKRWEKGDQIERWVGTGLLSQSRRPFSRTCLTTGLARKTNHEEPVHLIARPFDALPRRSNSPG